MCESSRDAAFRLAWPTGRASVGNGTSTRMVGIGKDTEKATGFLRGQAVLKANKVTSSNRE